MEPSTQVTYLLLLDMRPSDPDTVLTATFKVKCITKEAGQIYSCIQSIPMINNFTK